MQLRQPNAGEDRDVLERELAIIQELLDEQSDSKCRDGASRFAYSSLMRLSRVHGIARLLQAAHAQEPFVVARR